MHIKERHSRNTEMRWFIAYTFPKAEHKAAEKLQAMDVTCFLPLHKVVRVWSDRKKVMSVPLFPNYIFIYTTLSRLSELLRFRELVSFVTFDGEAVTVKESLVNSLKMVMGYEVTVETFRHHPGTPVKIIEGPLAGVEGILEKYKGTSRLTLQIQALHRTVSVEVSCDTVIIA
ncbi:UpxY family transcription antiterminator [Chitinophaga nivalis]|uniref:UpxY family transcription antiterminator n=1 Tax=Chitinophaga nivalis TaxID=2991709 RepID=A0ABT3IKZ4_9BACT|nr:UpxY family transcription antiterminator [Chitinophaga nivalis]MCW3465677.1 UpxY family transcription antiterminator [Chitinophaga nivalis]MCW3484632.1 UpxY family transcription antiterminator [Chitinophaga nivalis]